MPRGVRNPKPEDAEQKVEEVKVEEAKAQEPAKEAKAEEAKQDNQLDKAEEPGKVEEPKKVEEPEKAKEPEKVEEPKKEEPKKSNTDKGTIKAKKPGDKVPAGTKVYSKPSKRSKGTVICCGVEYTGNVLNNMHEVIYMKYGFGIVKGYVVD